jgi:hypothetical protein
MLSTTSHRGRPRLTWRHRPGTATIATVIAPGAPAVVHAVPVGAVYSLLLLAHVACAVVGFGALAVTGVQARRARRGPGTGGSEAVRRYFRPGVNWAGRALYGVPLLGFALISASKGAFAAGDGFVIAGLGLWSLSTVVAETVVWPGERRIQEVVSTRWEVAGTDRRFDLDCRRVAASAVVLSGVFLLAVILMVAQP